MAEPNGEPYAFALNYNHLNRHGEPTVLCVRVDWEGDARISPVAESFGEFLAGQYFGDESPIVDLKEAGKYDAIAEGQYEGRYRGARVEGSLSGLPVSVRWKICSHRNRLLVFQEINWAGQVSVRREEISKTALVFDFPPLESHGLDIEPELAKMIRPGIEIEILSKYDADLVPDCFELLLHVQSGVDRMVRKSESSLYEGRWKNQESNLLYSSIKSADLAELQKVLQAVIASLEAGKL